MSKYDVVIIGSGLGGLCAGYILSKEGFSVCILEKNRQLGGSLQIFSREKAIFDTGIHYIGGLDEGQNLNRYFKYFGLMDKLKLKRMDMDAFDVISFEGDDRRYHHAQGYENFVNVLAAQFPGERENIQRYTEKIKEICNYFPLYRLGEDMKDLVTTGSFLEADTKAFIESVTTNKKLQSVLAGSNPLYAGVPDRTPLYVHALVVNTYIESSWKCIDGGAQMSTHLAKSIRGMGGVIQNYSEAVSFRFRGSEIESVELADGSRVEGKYFISNADISKTLDMIESGHVRPAYRSRINNLDNTISAFIVNLVFKKGSFPYMNYNCYHFATDDVWCGTTYTPEKWPDGLAIFTAPSSRHEGFADGMTAMSYMHYSETAKWAGTKSTIPNHISDRGQDYEDFKREKSEKIIDLLEKRFPGIRTHISSYTSSSPLTYRDYIGSRDGTLYGILKDYKDPLKTFITPRTKVPNLFLTGQNLNLHGVLGVTVSSVVTCSELLGQVYLIRKIKACS
ncbi:MAG TPA: NAD(P)/FAD-dependent oxidoreductase [Bacteroidia bacterium]|nr:NAD(P)/FAD-dependent oxidoreductase [Bacteroidia bacterium]